MVGLKTTGPGRLAAVRSRIAVPWTRALYGRCHTRRRWSRRMRRVARWDGEKGRVSWGFHGDLLGCFMGCLMGFAGIWALLLVFSIGFIVFFSFSEDVWWDSKDHQRYWDGVWVKIVPTKRTDQRINNSWVGCPNCVTLGETVNRRGKGWLQ